VAGYDLGVIGVRSLTLYSVISEDTVEIVFGFLRDAQLPALDELGLLLENENAPIRLKPRRPFFPFSKPSLKDSDWSLSVHLAKCLRAVHIRTRGISRFHGRARFCQLFGSANNPEVMLLDLEDRTLACDDLGVSRLSPDRRSSSDDENSDNHEDDDDDDE
jgi:hypothetical protein